jgi:hypothetical protein
LSAPGCTTPPASKLLLMATILSAAIVSGPALVAQTTVQGQAGSRPDAGAGAGADARSGEKPGTGESLTFHFEHPGAPVPEYTFTVHQGGTRLSYALGADGNNPTPNGLYLKPELVDRLFQQVAASNRFHPCESKVKNVANTGRKTLTYASGATGDSATCTYNFSENKAVTALTDIFFALEQTLEQGQKLEHDHRFDRLGLDQDMSYLVDAARENRAQGLSLIAPVLLSLVNDPAVLERVRTAAGKLLEQGNLGK